jgi:protein-S-isoprenylcysteine O-methyltransferase Ste14
MLLKFISITAFAVSVLGMIYLFKNHSIISDNPVAILIQVLAFGLMIWARITFGFRSFHASANSSKEKLVTNGPYKWLRHPIYSAVIYFFLACIISFPNTKTVIAVALIILSTIIRMLLEEKSLLENFEEYAAYSKRTKRFIPFVI